jgi:hypothetical protein
MSPHTLFLKPLFIKKEPIIQKYTGFKFWYALSEKQVPVQTEDIDFFHRCISCYYLFNNTSSVSFVLKRERTVNVILQSFQTVYLVQYDRCIPFNVLTVHRSWPLPWQFLTVLDRSCPFLTVPERFRPFYERIWTFFIIYIYYYR